MDEINKWIKDENEKRMAESEALRIRMEREKAELREFMERDNKAMQVRVRAKKYALTTFQVQISMVSNM